MLEGRDTGMGGCRTRGMQECRVQGIKYTDNGPYKCFEVAMLELFQPRLGICSFAQNHSFYRATVSKSFSSLFTKE